MSPTSRRPRVAVAVFALAFLLDACVAPAHALTTRCVGNASEFAAALAEAGQASADSPFVIKLREGSYASTPASGRFELVPHRSDQLVEVSGGWSGVGGTCTHKSFDPSRTTLAGGADRPALYFYVGTGISGTLVNLHDLALTNPDFIEVNHGACVRGVVEAGNQALLERLQFHDCIAPFGLHASLRISNSGELTLRNTAVRSGLAENNGGIAVFTSDNGISRLTQVSVTGTLSSGDDFLGSGITLINFDSGITHLSNSVSWGNDPDADTGDLWLNGDGIVMNRVHYGKLDGTPAANIVPGTGDPGFVAQGDPRLHADSLLVDSGIATPQGGSGTFDTDGRARVQGKAVDVGAYERPPPPDAIFADGFEPDSG